MIQQEEQESEFSILLCLKVVAVLLFLLAAMGFIASLPASLLGGDQKQTANNTTSINITVGKVEQPTVQIIQRDEDKAQPQINGGVALTNHTGEPDSTSQPLPAIQEKYTNGTGIPDEEVQNAAKGSLPLRQNSTEADIPKPTGNI